MNKNFTPFLFLNVFFAGLIHSQNIVVYEESYENTTCQITVTSTCIPHTIVSKGSPDRMISSTVFGNALDGDFLYS